MNTNQRAWIAALLLTTALAASGCREGIDRIPTEQEKIEHLRLMLPNKIEIQPFTSIRSFDEDNIPDGILLVLRPTDSFGDPVKAAGYFYFELWTFVNASQERKGERLAFWDRVIDSESDMRAYWTHTQMFEFQLAWLGQGVGSIEPGRKFVLTATWRTPWDTTVRDEYVLEFDVPFRALTADPGALPPPPDSLPAGAEPEASGAPPAGPNNAP